ncbi:MAG: hypothetical protein FWC40_02785 [Proteobacteria bacterium]|nr:hypothetical protein [Pseudomonadota bacterium]
MTSRIFGLCLAISCCFLPAVGFSQTPANSEIVVNVSARRMALALSPAVPRSQASEIGAKIDATLEHGLQLTGLFDLVPQGSFLPSVRNEALAKTDYGQWYASGAQVLIKAEYSVSGTHLELDFALYDVVENRRITLAYNKPAVTVADYSKAVYAFVNAVVKHFTGEDGFLGQTMLAVARSGKGQPSRVVTMTTDGQNISNVVKHSAIQMLPAWGPGGGVLLTSYMSGNPDLYLASGGVLRKISGEAGMNSGADYCASNGRIVLTLSKDGNAEIYSMAASGGDLRRLTNHASIDTSPVWSPDCSRIAFVSDRGGNPQIYVMQADGSGVRRLTTVGKYNTNPSWGRQGYIAFSARDEDNGLDIFVMREDGSNLMRVTQQQGRNDKPAWSPDGRYLAFSSTRDGGSRIYISTADGKSQFAVTRSGWFENPVWAP